VIKRTTEADTELLVIADLRVEGDKGEEEEPATIISYHGRVSPEQREGNRTVRFR
jgi:hypothetical protein